MEEYTGYTIHNVRFYDFEPKSIQCMAYEDETNRLALSRADGSIEIWNCQKRPFMQRVIHGNDDSSVEALAWCNGRLFSAGLHGFLLEYDMVSCGVKSRAAVTGGPTWCLAISPDKQTLAAGTEEGFVCLFTITDEGVLYKKTLQRQPGRILCIGWHSSGDYLATGSTNSVQFWSLNEDKVTMCSLGQPKGKEIIVWCVGVLDDLTIVSGDSRGKTCFWNSKLGIINVSVQSHRAGVLCLAICPSQTSLYVAGVDPSIVQIQKVKLDTKKGKKESWVKSVQRSIHTHDIRAMALTKEDKLFSGGVDTVLTLSFYPPRTVLKFPALPSPGSISVAGDADSLLLRYKRHIELWQLGKSSKKHSKTVQSSGSFLPITQNRVKMLELHCKKNEEIEWSAVSSEAKWIAYIVQRNLKIFQFHLPEDGTKMNVERVKMMGEDIKKSHQVLWLNEGRLASATTDGDIQIIAVSDMEAKLEKTLTQNGNCVYQMKSDASGNILVVVDSREIVTAFDLETETMKILPEMKGAPVTAIGVHPTLEKVIVVYANMMIKEYDLKHEQYTDYCRKYLSSVPVELVKRHSVIRDVSYDAKQERDNVILLHDDSSLIVLDKKKTSQQQVLEKPAKLKKTNNQNVNIQKNISLGFTFVRRPNQVLHFAHVNKESVVSVELITLQLLDRLPPTLRVKKYGGM